MTIGRKMLAIAILALLQIKLFAQESEVKKFPAQMAFVYPLSTSGANSVNYQYNFSLNALVGSVGGLKGFEVGGLINFNKGNMIGGEIAGLMNLTNGDVKGAQIGGILNTADSVVGLQVGGIVNITSQVKGLQVGGIVNVSEDVEGCQIGGIVNINNGNTSGFQLAGILNKTGTLKNGFQLGLINIADTIEDGASLGLINIYKKGAFKELEISFADYAHAKVTYKRGSKKLYTLYSIGSNFLKDQLWIAGIGIGQNYSISENFTFQPELIYHMYFPQDFKQVKYNHSSHLKLGFVYHLTNHLGVFIAPSIYVMNQEISESNSLHVSSIKSLYTYTSRYHQEKLDIGVGLSVGLKFW